MGDLPSPMTDKTATPTGRPTLRRANASISNNLPGGGRKSIVPEFDFNLGGCKARVLKAFEGSVPATFKRYYASPPFDRLVQQLALVFIARFQHEYLARALDRARRQHLDGYNPMVIAAKLVELEHEAAEQQQRLSPLYAEIILKHSTYEKPQQDRQFFESLYTAVIEILDEAFQKLNRRADLENQVGLFFRTRHFNMPSRHNQPTRSVDTLSVKEIYAVKHESPNRALSQKLIASLYEKPHNIEVQVASLSNSPLITQFITSPIVARSFLKDPELQARIFGSANGGTRSKPADDPALQSLHSLRLVSMGTPPLKGLMDTTASNDASPTRGPLARDGLNSTFNATAGATLAGSTMQSPRTGRLPSSTTSRFVGTVTNAAFMAVPEMAGLLHDEAYYFLALLKRYLLYGPSLGFQNLAAPGGATGSTATRTTSNMAPMLSACNSAVYSARSKA